MVRFTRRESGGEIARDGMALVTVWAEQEGRISPMRRFAAIITIAVVVLALTAGPAFASVCAGTSCGPVMVCATSNTPSCPMENGVPMAHASCGHPVDRGSRDVASTQPAQEAALASTPLSGVFVPPVKQLLTAAHPLSDARGAPHLTSVIRI